MSQGTVPRKDLSSKQHLQLSCLRAAAEPYPPNNWIYLQSLLSDLSHGGHPLAIIMAGISISIIGLA